MQLTRREFALGAVLAATSACGSRTSAGPRPAVPSLAIPDPARALDPLAERYVRLVLGLGRHDPDYVDAYYGPPAWKREADAEAAPLVRIAEGAAALEASLAASFEPTDPLLKLRRRYLARQTAALSARVAMLSGKRRSFDDESEGLYDARVPARDDAEFEAVHAELARHLPGTGSLTERLDRFRDDFVIPTARLRPVFEAAIAEARRRTERHLALPQGESLALEFVTHQSWSGYNWYLGDAKSKVQINTDLPIFAIRAIDVASHESYPGHHVYNALLEQHLVRARGFVELSVYALYSPQSLIAEGSANYGVELAFPDRAAFLRDVLLPIAGLRASEAERYVAVEELDQRLGYVDIEAARRLLDGRLTRAGARAYLIRHGLTAPARADKFLDRVEVSRSYVINYSYGRDLVAAWVARQPGAAERHDARWAAFRDLLASPRLPADLR
ncbi:MAG: hypothetical protein ABW252_23095 [Polyangiales bacterium]